MNLINPPIERVEPCPYCGEPTVPYTPAIAAHNGARYAPQLYGDRIHVAQTPTSVHYFSCGMPS